MPPSAASTFRCESCGYDLSVTDSAARCPECGVRVWCSLPRSRRGLFFQRRGSVANWAKTAWGFVRSPAGLFRDARPEEANLYIYFLLNCVGAGIIAVTPFYARLVADAYNRTNASVWLVLTGLLVAAVLLPILGAFITVVIASVFFLVLRLVVRMWASALGYPRESQAVDVVALTSTSALLLAACSVPITFAFTTVFRASPIGSYADLVFGGCVEFALLIWLRGVHIGLRELRYANPPPIARDDADTPPPPHVFTESISPSAR